MRRSFLTQFQRTLSTYGERLGAFQPNARLYLVSIVLTGAAFGVYRLLFNFYVLSLGYDESLLGNLITASSLTALIAAVPMGYLGDFLGRKNSLILSVILPAITVGLLVVFPYAPAFLALNVLMGLGQSLGGVTMGPFLMENSSEKERTYVFSFTSGLQMASAFVGNWLGGYLPTWLAGGRNLSTTSTEAYAISLLVISAAAFLSLVPLFFLRSVKFAQGQRSFFAPFSYFKQHPALLGKLILPMLITSIGAGMIIPFMNVFFRQVYHQTDTAIGSLFAFGSLAMGIGLVLAPPLADRFGKIQLVVFTQGLSIPFLIMLGFSPWYAMGAVAYFVRNALMNMSGPVYQTFVMENVEANARATVASLVSMASNFGWAFSPTISGFIQVNYGFQPAFMVTIVLYAVSVFLYWNFFLHRQPAKYRTIPVQEESL